MWSRVKRLLWAKYLGLFFSDRIKTESLNVRFKQRPPNCILRQLLLLDWLSRTPILTQPSRPDMTAGQTRESAAPLLLCKFRKEKAPAVTP